ncbi:hypothetical protein MASR2M64_15230 [Candidatus Cloacimonadota bacterium]
MSKIKLFLLSVLLVYCLSSLAAQANVGDTQEVLAPLISVSPTTIDFGSINVGSTATQNFTISNPGTETLSGQIYCPNFLSIAASGADGIRALRSSQYPETLPGDRIILDYSVSAGESREFSVSFIPQDAEEYYSSISIIHNAAAPVQEIEISGIGLQAILDINEESVEVDLYYGEYATEFVELRNMGNIPLTYTASRAPGTTFFSINGSTGTSGTIPPGYYAVLEILVYASAVEGRSIGGIHIFCNDPDHPFSGIAVIREVRNPNHPPMLYLPSVFYVPYNGYREFDFRHYASDPDDDPLGGGVVTGGPISYTGGRIIPALDWYGVAEIQVSVSDGEFVVTDDLTVIVNAPPVLDLPESFSFAHNDSLLVDLFYYIADPDDSFSHLTLSLSGNSAISINQLGFRAWFSAPNGFAGSESITVSVADGHNVVQGSFLVNVINHAPVLNLPGDFSLNQNGSLSVDFSPFISDPDGDLPVLSYSGNNNIGVVQEDYSITFSPIYDWFGSEEICFTISDGLLQASAMVQITVNQVIDLDTPVLMISANLNGLFISWQPIDYASEYQVYRASEPNGSYSLVATTGNTMYFESDPPERAFYYVKAVHMP